MKTLALRLLSVFLCLLMAGSGCAWKQFELQGAADGEVPQGIFGGDTYVLQSSDGRPAALGKVITRTLGLGESLDAALDQNPCAAFLELGEPRRVPEQAIQHVERREDTLGISIVQSMFQGAVNYETVTHAGYSLRTTAKVELRRQPGYSRCCESRADGCGLGHVSEMQYASGFALLLKSNSYGATVQRGLDIGMSLKSGHVIADRQKVGGWIVARVRPHSERETLGLRLGAEVEVSRYQAEALALTADERIFVKPGRADGWMFTQYGVPIPETDFARQYEASTRRRTLSNLNPRTAPRNRLSGLTLGMTAATTTAAITSFTLLGVNMARARGAYSIQACDVPGFIWRPDVGVHYCSNYEVGGDYFYFSEWQKISLGQAANDPELCGNPLPWNRDACLRDVQRYNTSVARTRDLPLGIGIAAGVVAASLAIALIVQRVRRGRGFLRRSGGVFDHARGMNRAAAEALAKEHNEAVVQQRIFDLRAADRGAAVSGRF